MEVVAATPGNGGVPPFHDHDVREWSRIDSLTGVLERARLETDHWTANTNNSSHKYGKVVDSRARTNADGALQQQARRQLEVFQSQIPGGHLQVIKTQTVSSSRWSNKSSNDFENLQLSLNPLDLTSQKSKANVGRSVGRRPPSRPRAKDESSIVAANPLNTAQHNNLQYRVSRLCHQIHENTVKQHFGQHHNRHQLNNIINNSKRENGDGIEIKEIETIHNNNSIGYHPLLSRTKSTSSEDLHLTNSDDKSSKSTEDLEDLEELQNWRRTSKLRRSLQYPNKTTIPPKPPSDLPENIGSVRKIREELEKGRRLSTALRGNNVDLEALDQILQSISSSSSSSSSSSTSHEEKKQQKRNSFITVETLQEVKGRLRRTTDNKEENEENEEEEEADDGIVTEESPPSRVRSYVFGMENNNKPISSGTGSLESRSKLLNGTTNLRNEDWYNRRKSYGFEQVHNHAADPHLRTTKGTESSTDSGIYRSSEIVRDSGGSVKEISSIFDQGHVFNSNTKDLKSTTITIPINKTNFVDLSWNDNNSENEHQIKRHSIAVDESKYVTGDGNCNDNKFRRTSLVINPINGLDDANNHINRKLKKVEFCKTEVHFGEGKVNIVETDEKPPPTNNFRRRRRNSGPILNSLSDLPYERSNLPVLHFGDSSYEKVLLGVSDEDFPTKLSEDDSNIPCATVTVNTNYKSFIQEDADDDKKDTIENVKGILKNKPIKPIPYRLGEEHFLNNGSSDSDSGKWGVRLKSIHQNDPPFWKSTVTLHNTVYNKENDKNTEQPPQQQPEFQKLLKNLRPINSKPDLIATKPWQTDRNDDTHWAENKVYSTKVNFGDGGSTTVVSNDKSNSIWTSKKDSDRVLNKGLVVRIGRTAPVTPATTTTKITIDLSPSPTNSKTLLVPPVTTTTAKRSHSFKSTSLILDTIHKKEETSTAGAVITKTSNVPQQLAALKKLYEDELSDDSDADKEVQSLMGKMDNSLDDDDQCNTSEVSGSWSKMRAFRTVSECLARAKIEKGDVKQDAFNIVKKPPESVKIKLQDIEFSPRRTSGPISSLKTTSPSEKLNSPSLVGRNATNSNKTSSEFVNLTDVKLHQKHTTSDIVLRQPKKSEMTYFGVNVTPKQSTPIKKQSPSVQTVIEAKETNLSEKPDLLQHMKTASPVVVKRTPKPRQTSPKPASSEPIYENLNSGSSHQQRNNRYGRDFDANILEELTKAADQILQAVNGFTDDDHEQPVKEPLDTINESKSWSQASIKNKGTKPATIGVKAKLKATSSNSSIESLNLRKANVRKPIQNNNHQQLLKKKNVPGETNNKANTKARRLQRASSREALLLQSHGSSSEDLGANVVVPQRKPRQVKKTKTMQLSITNGIEMSKRTPPNAPRRKRDDAKKIERDVEEPVAEIRHKTAVSTIRSTAEKSSRERSTSRTVDAKKRIQHHRESSKVLSASKSDPKRSTVSSREISNHRISTANIKKCHRAEGSNNNNRK